MRSASNFRISRKNAARIHLSQDDIEQHLVVALTAIKFTASHLSLVFDFGFNIKSVHYLSNAKAADVVCVLKESILDIKSARSDFTSGEISDIVQCVQFRDSCNYGRTIGAFLVYSKILELSSRSTPCTKATKWLLSNGSIHYNEGSVEDKTDVSTALRNHVEYIEAGDLFCSADYMKTCQTVYNTKKNLVDSGIIKSISHVTLSPWTIENYTQQLHLTFETAFVFILSSDIFTLFSSEWPLFTSVALVTAGEPISQTLTAMTGIIKNIFVVGLDTEPNSTIGLKLQWIACSLQASKVKDASLVIQTALPYWRIDNPLRWSLIPTTSSRVTNTAEAIQHLEYDLSTIRVSSFDEIEQTLGTVFSKLLFVIADHRATRDYYKSISESPVTPPLRSSGRKILRGSGNASMMSVDWEISRQSSDPSSPTLGTPSGRQFTMKDFIERHRKDFKVISELTHKTTHEYSAFLLCFSDKECHKFYLEEVREAVDAKCIVYNNGGPKYSFRR